ncbi:ATP-dependent (S)-NAD(P)H-hydrate dehydratase [Dictyocoela muelleri]|nr:ATP-dependent (S)-NAD(P)H-hydrate dehydratase [Dictyocoela muelleri]
MKQKELFKIKDSYRLNQSAKKGDNGVVLIIGGSKIYTGAPYFASITAYRSGCDLVYIFTTNPDLKILCPESVVCTFNDNKTIPFTDDNNLKNLKINNNLKNLKVNVDKYNYDFDNHFIFADTEYDWILPRVSICIVGCGLGRIDFSYLKAIMRILLKINVPVIFDGDGLHYFNYFRLCCRISILTPNFNEFNKLKQMFSSPAILNESNKENDNKMMVFSDLMPLKNDKMSINLAELEKIKDIAELNVVIDKKMCLKTDNTLKSKIFIIKKGEIDIITDLNRCVEVNFKGSLKRCAGQGDILCGIIAGIIKKDGDIMLSLELACKIMRRSAFLAYEKFKRSLMVSDILEFLSVAVNEFLE